jgi:uncharacterized peroxidase-related enzyme
MPTERTESEPCAHRPVGEKALFLSDPPEDPAVRALYEEARAEDGYVMNLIRVWAWRPDVHAAFLAARMALLGETTLSKREIAVLNATTAAERNDSYCAIAWGTRVAELVDAQSAGVLLRGEEPAALSAREIAVARWARVVAKNPNAATADDVETLRAARLSEREIFDATLLVAFRLAFTTVNDALGAQPDRQLVDEAPPSVVESVTFGRTVD